MKIFSASSLSALIFQHTATVGAFLGLFIFNFDVQAWLVVLLGCFMYGGIGFSMMLHRYYTHKSFEFKNSIVKWLCTFCALAYGRGSVIGWVYVHRQHHAFSDTDKDPHTPNKNIKGILFPSYSGFNIGANKGIVRDLFTRPLINIDKYYNLIVLGWVVVLFFIDPWLAYFGWFVPVLITNLLSNSFVVYGHKEHFGYQLTDTKDTSQNTRFYGYLFWGEGWHNDHHAHPRKWKYGEKWWELDPMAPFISLVKK